MHVISDCMGCNWWIWYDLLYRIWLDGWL